MKIPSTVLIAWWLYVNTFAVLPAYPFPYFYPVWQPRQRFLHQEFCELNAKQLRREGFEAFCRYVDD